MVLAQDTALVPEYLLLLLLREVGSAGSAPPAGEVAPCSEGLGIVPGAVAAALIKGFLKYRDGLLWVLRAALDSLS